MTWCKKQGVIKGSKGRAGYGLEKDEKRGKCTGGRDGSDWKGDRSVVKRI